MSDQTHIHTGMAGFTGAPSVPARGRVATVDGKGLATLVADLAQSLAERWRR